jgi:hypothetical protein
VLVASDAAIRRARAEHVAGPILDRAAADAIERAAARGAPPPTGLSPVALDVDALRARAARRATPDPIAAARDRAALEAELEAEARAANDLGAPSSADPGTATPPEGKPAGPSPELDPEPPPGVDPATL